MSWRIVPVRRGLLLHAEPLVDTAALRTSVEFLAGDGGVLIVDLKSDRFFRLEVGGIGQHFLRRSWMALTTSLGCLWRGDYGRRPVTSKPVQCVGTLEMPATRCLAKPRAQNIRPFLCVALCIRRVDQPGLNVAPSTPE